MQVVRGHDLILSSSLEHDKPSQNLIASPLFPRLQATQHSLHQYDCSHSASRNRADSYGLHDLQVSSPSDSHLWRLLLTHHTTSRARKVKCKEAWPKCSRCQRGGRKCAGYREPPVGSFSWSQLLQTRPSILPLSTATSADLRRLDFFRCIVAPALAGPSKRAFWTECMAVGSSGDCRLPCCSGHQLISENRK